MSLFVRVAQVARWWRHWRTLPVRPWLDGASLFRSGQYRRAIAAYRRGLASHPDHRAAESARLDLAYCLVREFEFDEALEELARVTSGRSCCRDGYLSHARLLAALGSRSQAANLLCAARNHISFDGELAGLFLYYAISCGVDSDLAREALSVAEMLEERGEKNPLLKTGLAAFLREVGRRDDAFALVEEALSLGPAPVEALLLRAEMLLEVGSVECALDDILRAVRAEPYYPHGLSLLARVYLTEGATYQPSFALNAAVTACQHSGWRSPRELKALAEVYFRAGDRDLARMVARKALEVSDHDGSDSDRCALDEFIATLGVDDWTALTS